ncbi:McrC family protein [Nesterenkonia sp. AY15]|uniref:McrC family protein n=1 Tax=Nesterenkonia sp. AY15 TaxID=2901139 RepID=UPI001F4CE1AE|nr:McrC family protein [Nesterenkonia sp. AY15]MCH8570251.1 McrC family protein [Nesterenkonia sp. AY15]
MKPEQFLLDVGDRNGAGADPAPILDVDLNGWRAGRYIGEIHHQGRTLQIRPRLGIETVAQWISAIHNVHVLPDVAGGSRSYQPLVIQLTAALWRASILDAGRHTLAREKVKRKSAGLRVRGKLDVAATGKLRAAGDPELVSNSTFRTLDNSTNAVVVAADRVINSRMGSPRWRGPRIEDQLIVLKRAVGSNPQLPSRGELKRARYSPLEVKWRKTAELSHMIASNRLLRHNAEASDTYGLLIDVAELWERFVLHCASEAFEAPVIHGTSTTVEHRLLSSVAHPDRGMGRLYPDILINPSTETNSYRCIIDAKYKPLTQPRGVDREDLYQIHAYSQAFNAQRSLLAYPVLDGDTAFAQRFSPWDTGADAEISFLRLPIEQTECVAALQAWDSGA